MSGMRAQTVYCSFCGRRPDQVRVLVSKDDGSAAICDECVRAVVEEMAPTMDRILDLEDEVRRLGT